MTHIWIAPLAVAGFVLVVDLVTTCLRKRARRVSITQESMLTEQGLEDLLDEGVALNHD